MLSIFPLMSYFVIISVVVRLVTHSNDLFQVPEQFFSVIELSMFGMLLLTMYISHLLPDFVAQF